MSRMIDDEETLKDNGLIEIDGVNVAECNSFLNEYEFPNNFKGGYYTEINLCECGVQGATSYPFFCKDNSDCYFKQLQRAKAEITHWAGLANEANERATEYGNECNKLIEKISELKAENEKLKEEVKEIRTWEELKLSKYRKALEDIKNLNNKTVKIPIITEKINEVLNEG